MHAFNTANAVVFHLVIGELKVLEAAIMEVSKPPSAKLDVEQESKSAEAGKDDKAAGKGKKGKVSKINICSKIHERTILLGGLQNLLPFKRVYMYTAPI